ncbi:MAG: DegT/DnrJ/EryC1/StrS family aminotransferase [Chitinophagales bacterium]
MRHIPMVNLQEQYLHIKSEINRAILDCLDTANFIRGKEISAFEKDLALYLNVSHVIGCGNGTDALQIALMALDLPKGSKIIVPAFTYIAPVEVIKLLGHEIVYADVDSATFNITPETIEQVYTDDVKAIIPVHLFGQCCNMRGIVEFAQKHTLTIIEDNAQSLGAIKGCTHNGIITASFFPTKNLGAYGDGGALMTNDDTLAKKIRTIANHGQTRKYDHELIGVNSRLDAIQAAILSVKLKYLNEFILRRQQVAAFYDAHLKHIPQIQIPARSDFSTHTFHQYTIKTNPAYRDKLQQFLMQREISSAIYYPMPCYKQKAYLQPNLYFPNAEMLSASVLSLPIYPEISEEQLLYICNSIKAFFDTI